jgi:hypothetical protein
VASAWLGFNVSPFLPAAIIAFVLLVGAVAFAFGKQSLPDDPIRAVTLLEWSVLLDYALGTVASSVLVWLGVQLEPSEDASTDSKKLLAATFGAISGLLTALFIKGAEEADEGWVGSRIAKRFRLAYAGRFEPGSAPWRAIHEPDFAGESGWGKAARRVRAAYVLRGLGTVDDLKPATKKKNQ